MSVCTGSALLAAAGVLDGRCVLSVSSAAPRPPCTVPPPTLFVPNSPSTHRQATSNKAAWQWVTGLRRDVRWVRRARWLHDGRFLTSSGVSAGTDAAVYAVKVLLSAEEAAAAARRLEHVPITQAQDDAFADEAFVPAV
jgi:transcriptional regulator GlxA family with amidase domain